MATDYLQRLQPVIRYLERHYNQPLNLSKVAALAHLSPYHFHRIFKAVTGETLNDYLRRLRLEGAAGDLFYTKAPVVNVAMEYGFSSSQSLAKAFRQYFGLTPTQIRDCQVLEELSQVLRSSKIGHRLRKPGHDSAAAVPYTGTVFNSWSTEMNHHHFEAGTMAFIRVTGPYGQGYEAPCTRLHQWAQASGLGQCKCLFIYHDNPEITPAEHCRTDIGLLVPQGTRVPQGVELQPFDGGDYATIRKTVSEHDQYVSSWNDLLGQVVAAGLECDDRFCFEWYHDVDLATGVADVSFCTAIRAG
ncbi:AraC family transcriptional regulator [Ferrimonas sediminum]|uniref:AraC family transcriptional regulator n=1 Tax=Ferrimonas sediminum TaxID=718193 RepID=A0A1G8JMU1_9GAMM|nr:AraC family transcriptional regulator [Ferrimonas sediminum]SDI31950.1 AraC family transcriptional regulator [Ferrimonas sediminum]